MTAPLRAKKKNNTIVWALLGLLVVSLTGFGVQSVGSGGSQAIATIGDEKVTVDAYYRALNSQLQAMSRQFGQNITLQQGLAFGVDRQTQRQVLASAALNGESSRIGLSVGDQLVKDNLLNTEAFQALTGGFDKVAYESALDRANLKPAEYEEIIRKDATRTLLRAGMSGGVSVGDTYGLALLNFLGQKRSFDWALVDQSMLPEPTRDANDGEVRAYYEANPDKYTAPEARVLTYVHLSPDMLIPTIETDDAALRAYYDEQSGRFNQPARRIVDRLVFGSTQEAQEALDKITSGSKIFADIVATRGLTLEDIDLGEVTKSDLASGAADAVFLLGAPGLLGPVESSLGPALFRVNAILAAQSTSFEDAKATLHTELVADRARRNIDALITEIDDLLAGGAALEDIAVETAMELSTIRISQDDSTGINAYETFRTAAASVTKEDFPEVLTLSDGGIFALRLDEIVPPTLKTYDVVKADAAADWKTAETRIEVLQLAADLKIRLEGGETFAELGLTAKTETDLQRDDFIKEAPVSLVTELFEAQDAEIKVVKSAEAIVVARLNGTSPFDPADSLNKTTLDSVRQRYAQQIGSDIFDAYIIALQNEAGITLNQSLIAAVHAQIP